MIKNFALTTLILITLVFYNTVLSAQNKDKAVIAYYSGGPERIDSFDAKLMTHIIFCFAHLANNRMKLGSYRDTLTIQKMVALKQKNPALKVLISLGGWGGCQPCSDAFATKKGRNEFAGSVKDLTDFFAADGIDLDWEYPSIEGYPGHKYSPKDKKNFTSLVYRLRKTLGDNKIISFAAGGFSQYLDKAVNWKKVVKKTDYINLMTYDLINGYSKQTGHHTALFSNPSQPESTDNAVEYLLRKHIDPAKIIIGAAFYARIWENVPDANNGLYQPGKFKSAASYKDFPVTLSHDSGFVNYWDDVSKAPYAYNSTKKLFATFDNKRSLTLKSKYVIEKKLGGLMFWELNEDTFSDGLLQTINTVFNP